MKKSWASAPRLTDTTKYILTMEQYAQYEIESVWLPYGQMGILVMQRLRLFN